MTDSWSSTRIAIAIDPGETVGVCQLVYEVAAQPHREGWQTSDLVSMPMRDFVGTYRYSPLRDLAKWADELVVEEFRLYRDKAEAQAGSVMPTSQVIGAIVAACRWCQHRSTQAGLGAAPKRGEGTPIFMQQASSKEVMRKQLHGRGIVLEGRNPHERDAELHALYWYFRGRYKGKETPL